jgi:hypothetical protein
MVEIDPTAEPGELPTATTPVVAKGRRAFLSARRSLTEKEMSSPATVLQLIDDLERLEGENTGLIEYRSKFHEADKALAVLQTKAAGNTGNDIVFGVALSLGAGAIGYAPSVWSGPNGTGPVILGLGCLMVGIGVVARLVQK